MARVPDPTGGHQPQRVRRSSLPALLYKSKKEAKPMTFKPIMETHVERGTEEGVPNGKRPQQPGAGHMEHPGFYPPGDGPGVHGGRPPPGGGGGGGGGGPRHGLGRRTSLQDTVIEEEEPLVLPADYQAVPPHHGGRRSSRCSHGSLEGSIPEETGSDEEDCATYEAELARPKKQQARTRRVNRAPVYGRQQSVPVEVYEGDPEYDLSRSFGGHSLDTHADSFHMGGPGGVGRGPRRRKSFLDVFTDIRRASTSLHMPPGYNPLRRRSSFWDTMAGVDDPLDLGTEDGMEKDIAQFRRSRTHISRRPSMPLELGSAWLPEEEKELPATIPEEGGEETEEGAAPAEGKPPSEEPPDGGWGWVIVFAVGLTFFISGGYGRSFTLTYQQLLYKFGDSSTATSLVAAIFGTVKMFSSPMVSALTNRFSHRRVAVVGGVISCVCMIVNAFPPNLLFLYVSYGVVTAFATNMVTTPSLVIIGQYFRKKKGKAMGLAMLGVSFGGMAFPPLMEYLYRNYGYTGAMIIVGGVMLHYCISGMLFRPLVPKVKFESEIKRLDTNENMKPEAEVTANGGGGDRRPSMGRSQASFSLTGDLKKSLAGGEGDAVVDIEDSVEVRAAEGNRKKPMFFIGRNLLKRKLRRNVNHNNNNSNNASGGGGRCCACSRRVLKYVTTLLELGLLKEPRFVLFALLMVGTFVCLSVTTNFIAGLAEEAGVPQSQVAVMISVSAFCDMPSRLLSGLLFDLKVVRENHRPTLFPIMGLLTGTFTFSLGLCRTYSSMFGFWLAYTFCASAYHTQHITVLSDIVGTRQLTGALGLSRMFMGVGLIIGPTLGGYMKDTRGSYHVSYYVGGSALIVTSILFQVFNLVCFRKSAESDSSSSDIDDEEPSAEFKPPPLLLQNRRSRTTSTGEKADHTTTTDDIKLLDEKLHQCESNSENSGSAESSDKEDEGEVGAGAGGKGPRRKSVSIIYEEENERGNSSDKGYN